MVRFFSAMVPQDADFDHAEGNSDADKQHTFWPQCLPCKESTRL